jgi:hypothetical protein
MILELTHELSSRLNFEINFESYAGLWNCGHTGGSRRVVGWHQVRRPKAPQAPRHSTADGYTVGEEIYWSRVGRPPHHPQSATTRCSALMTRF